MSTIYEDMVDNVFFYNYNNDYIIKGVIMEKKLSTREITTIGIFTALIIIIGQISIPMPYGVPMTLQTFIIPLAGIVLGARKGFIATLIYVFLGLIGLPVFAGFTGGIGIVLGPTGGFILSFPIMALAAGIGSNKNNKLGILSGLLIGVLINYISGMIMFSFVTSSTIVMAFTVCVLPFIPTQILKIILLVLVGERMKMALLKERLI